MRVNEGGLQAAVAQEPLDEPDVCPFLQEVGGETVAEGVDRGVFGDICLFLAHAMLRPIAWSPIGHTLYPFLSSNIGSFLYVL